MPLLRRNPPSEGHDHIAFPAAGPLVYPTPQSPAFLLANHRHRFLLYDVGGNTRVRSRCVAGGATVVADRDVIRVGSKSFTLVVRGLAVSCSPPAKALCSFCREPFDAAEEALQCASCQALVHRTCFADFTACGRCGDTLREEERA